jgi:hypothetical protein
MSEPMQARNNAGTKKSAGEVMFNLDEGGEEEEMEHSGVDDASGMLEAERIDVMTSTSDIPAKPAPSTFGNWAMSSISKVLHSILKGIFILQCFKHLF